MPRLLLLASSSISPERANAARAIGLSAVRELGAGDVLLLRKDAFAVEASERGFRRVAFTINGDRIDDGIAANEPWYPVDHIQPYETVSWPLYRDRSLVKAAAKAQEAGWDVSALIVRDSHYDAATDHLVRTCKELGIAGKSVLASISGPPVVVQNNHEWSDFDMVFVDLETTGLSEKVHAIIQIGAVHCDRYGKIVRREYKSMVRPWDGALIDPVAMEVNGLSPDDWKNEPEPCDSFAKFLSWLPPKFIYANQNASFDRRHMTAAFERHGLPIPGWHPSRMDVCTKRLAQERLVKPGTIADAKLATICRHYGIANDSQHDALVDARRARMVYIAMTGTADEATSGADV